MRRRGCFAPAGFLAMTLAVLLLPGCAGMKAQQPILATVRSGRLEWAGDLPVLHVYGSSYEMGYQHGSLLREQVRASVERLLAYADAEMGIPLAGKVFARRKLDAAWREMERFLPPRYLEEMEGVADGAGIPLRLLKRAHAVPDLTSPEGAGFAAAGSATRDGRLVHAHNLDWAMKSGIQGYAAVIVRHPAKGRASASAGWLGLVGALSGINEDGISVGAAAAATVDEDFKGLPMPFLLRLVLEESPDLERAVSVVRNSPRTAGYNYLFGDAKAKRAVALETTRGHCAAFWMGQEPADVPYGLRVPDAIFRSDFVVDREVRDKQTACGGNPSKPGLESPEGSDSYDGKYKKLAVLLEKNRGLLGPETAEAIAGEIAGGGNLQSVVYVYPEMYVANARGREPAAKGSYQRVDLRELFGGAP